MSPLVWVKTDGRACPNITRDNGDDGGQGDTDNRVVDDGAVVPEQDDAELLDERTAEEVALADVIFVG